MPTNFATQRTYRGANVLNLWMAQTALGYETAEWMTFKQARDLDACVRKGEHGTPVFFVSALEREEKNAKGELVEQHIPFWKSFTVFNIAQSTDCRRAFRWRPGQRSNVLRVSTHISPRLAQPSVSVAIARFTHPRPIRSLFPDLSNSSPSPHFTRRPVTSMVTGAALHTASRANSVNASVIMPTVRRRVLRDRLA